MLPLTNRLGLAGLLFGCLLSCQAVAEWRMWRADERRSGDWEGDLPERLHLQWSREYPALESAYHHSRLQFDSGYEPILTDGVLVIGSSRNDRVTGLDAATGEELWRFYTEGPVRFAPVGHQGMVLFGSDDGHFYCLNTKSGELVWKFRAVPSDRKVLGNRRVISVWPIRGGPVVADETVYFAAGVWSFEGVFVYALDVSTGQVQWVNDRTGFLYGQHPHDAKAFGGLTPQGYLVVRGRDLVVPCGTALPAIFDRHSGELKSFELPKAGRSPGGWFTAAAKAQRRGQTIQPEDQDESTDEDDSLADRLLFDVGVNRDLHEGGWHVGRDATESIRSRVRLNGQEYDFEAGFPGVQGTVHSILAGDGRLFVVTREGRLMAFGAEPIEPIHHRMQTIDFQTAAESGGGGIGEELSREIEEMLRVTDAAAGYAVVMGGSAEEWIGKLLGTTGLKLVVVDSDQGVCDRLRRKLDDSDLLGTRVAVLCADPLRTGLPPYLANLVVVPDPNAVAGEEDEVVAEWYRLLRPFGGTACIAWSNSDKASWAARFADGEPSDERFEGGSFATSGRWSLLSRPGPLAGATNYVDGWSSSDERVKAPLGVLWFDDSVAHFKRAPQPMMVDGVMISYDKDWQGYSEGKRPPYPLMPPTYSDIYTGRVLSAEEVSRVADRLPTRDITERQPDQYRPPSQTNAWKPEPPLAGERINPLTGQTEPRSFPKSYGCDGGIDYQYLYTMRSGTAAFYDKRFESGTVHISGPRSGCTNSIIPANGLLNVPYFFQGCTCSYPLPVGLALHSLSPEHEQWAVWGDGQPESIRRLGVNFGAPGARMTEAGTLWLEYPRVGGPAPRIELSLSPQATTPFYRHSLWMRGGVGWPWVTASGIEGLTDLVVSGLSDEPMTVRLYFAEPVAAVELASAEPEVEPRRFDIVLNGDVVLEDFEPARAAGGALRGVVREYAGVRCDGQLKIEFRAKQGQPLLCGLELIASGLPKDEWESDTTGPEVMPGG